MSSPAKERIVNAALLMLGQEPVTDLSEASLQGSVAAVKLLRVLDDAKAAILCRHGWVCALDYKTLTPAVIPAAPANWRYPTVFQLPGEALEVWEIEGLLREDWGPRWQVGTVEAVGGSAVKIIRAARQQPGQTALGMWGGDFAGPVCSLNVAYVRDCNWAALSRHLVDAVAAEAAARCAYSVTGDKTVGPSLQKEAETRVQRAIGSDGTQEGGQAPAAPSIPFALRNMSR